MNTRVRSQPLHRVGALWKPKPGSKAKGSGSISIKGWRQTFVVLANRENVNERAPDYVLMSADEPETDPYARSE